MYPFRVHTSDPKMQNLLDMLAKDRTAIITDRNLVKKVGIKLKPIRSDIFIGPDRKYYQSCISLKIPEMKIERLDTGKGPKYVFKI